MCDWNQTTSTVSPMEQFCKKYSHNLTAAAESDQTNTAERNWLILSKHLQQNLTNINMWLESAISANTMWSEPLCHKCVLGIVQSCLKAKERDPICNRKSVWTWEISLITCCRLDTFCLVLKIKKRYLKSVRMCVSHYNVWDVYENGQRFEDINTYQHNN